MMRRYDMTITFDSTDPVELCPVNDGSHQRCKHQKGHGPEQPHDLVDVNEIDVEQEITERLAGFTVRHWSESLAQAITALTAHPDLSRNLEKIMEFAQLSEEDTSESQ
jgi:hypothetical protein